MPVRIDPEAPGAQPVYDLLTPEPFRDLRQELTGALKAWKTSHQLLNEAQLYKAYAGRSQVDDLEKLDLLLRSAWERYIPAYYWAATLDAKALVHVLTDVIMADHYPASQEALKIAALLPRDHAKSLFHLIEASPRKSFKRAAKKFEPVLRARAKKYEALVEVLCPGQRLVYISGEGTKEVKLDAVNETTFEEVLRSLLDGWKENRGVFKAAELLVYGRRVALIDFSTLETSGAIADEGETPASVPIEVSPASETPIRLRTNLVVPSSRRTRVHLGCLSFGYCDFNDRSEGSPVELSSALAPPRSFKLSVPPLKTISSMAPSRADCWSVPSAAISNWNWAARRINSLMKAGLAPLCPVHDQFQELFREL
jgi:hypothetical protein